MIPMAGGQKEAGDRTFECIFCLQHNIPGPPFRTGLASAMVAHLLKHREQGHDVPDRTLASLHRCADDAEKAVQLLYEIGGSWARIQQSRIDLVARLPAKLRALLDQAERYAGRR